MEAFNYDKVLILDFGSQVTELIARRVREIGIYSEVHPFDLPLEKIKNFDPKAIILSGSPSSVYEEDSPQIDKEILNLNIPILGICYGMQVIAHALGGIVETSNKREYGRASIEVTDSNSLFKGFDKNEKYTVWMSHSDSIKVMPNGFSVIAKTESTEFCAIENKEKNIYALQFHPEVAHTDNGIGMIKNFLVEIAKCNNNWSMVSFIDYQVEKIRKEVGDKNVILGLSGGVDSSVAALLIHKAIGDKLHCIFVNNGVLRKNEPESVISTFKDKFNLNLTYVDASVTFLSKLENIVDPEQKRKIIGLEFIKVFESEAKKIDNVGFLAQGTLYPDVIESVSLRGKSDIIKTHHNVGGLPEKMSFKLLEPFRALFKDEVRSIGEKLGLPHEILYRHPFPGPGLAVRILGNITKKRIETLQEADAIVTEEIKNAGLYDKLWQAFAVLLPVKTVGVMGDNRTYEEVCALRAVESTDAMTADWAHIPYETLGKISNRIINEVKGINRVVYDVSSKPPATIEWE